MRFLQLVLALFFLFGLPACRQLSAALLTQGYHDYQKGDYDRAIQDYNQAIRLDANSASAFTGRGAAYFAKGDYERAIQDYNQAIRLDANSASAFDHRGTAYFAKGDYDRAIQDYNQAIRLNPKTAHALLARGLAHLYAGHASERNRILARLCSWIRHICTASSGSTCHAPRLERTGKMS